MVLVRRAGYEDPRNVPTVPAEAGAENGRPPRDNLPAAGTDR
jgi:hypothetical protein